MAKDVLMNAEAGGVEDGDKGNTIFAMSRGKGDVSRGEQIDETQLRALSTMVQMMPQFRNIEDISETPAWKVSSSE